MGIIKKLFWKTFIYIVLIIQVLSLSACSKIKKEKDALLNEVNHLEGDIVEETGKEQTPQQSFSINEGKGLLLTYDDRCTFDNEIDQIKTVLITSRQTGEDEADLEVLCQDPVYSNRVIACGCGTAIIYFHDGTSLEVNVLPAPISLFLLAGQSNAEGRYSDNGSRHGDGIRIGKTKQ